MALETVEKKSFRQRREEVTDLLQRGRLCGELDCLRKTSYSQTVRACRDSELCRVSPTLLQLIAMEFPQAKKGLSGFGCIKALVL